MKQVIVTVTLVGGFVIRAAWAANVQENCDYARVTASKVYTSCIYTVTARDAKAVLSDQFAAFARCRHAYFKKWNGFQNPGRKPALAGSSCVGARFTDNGDLTVTDNLTGLVWEKKQDLDFTQQPANPHDANNTYTWTTTTTAENGTAYTSFLASVNAGSGFGGANGWRLPTLAELETILLDFPCTGKGRGPDCHCPSAPCVDPMLDASNTIAAAFWTATTSLRFPEDAWLVFFDNGDALAPYGKGSASSVRAVRGGF